MKKLIIFLLILLIPFTVFGGGESIFRAAEIDGKPDIGESVESFLKLGEVDGVPIWLIRTFKPGQLERLMQRVEHEGFYNVLLAKASAGNQIARKILKNILYFEYEYSGEWKRATIAQWIADGEPTPVKGSFPAKRYMGSCSETPTKQQLMDAFQ